MIMVEAATQAPARARSRWGCFLGIVGGVALLAFALYQWSYTSLFLEIPAEQRRCERLNEGEFERHRDTYEGIVKAIENMGIAPGTSRGFLIGPDKDPTTLREVDPKRDSALLNRSNETNMIGVNRKDNGRLTVKVCTYSLGHAGVYGLYYSGGPPESGEVENSFGADGRIAPVGKNWWRVTDYSQ